MKPPEVDLERMLEESLAEELGSVTTTSGDEDVDAPDVQRTAAPAPPAVSECKYANHHFSDSENDIPGTSTSEDSNDESALNAHHRHDRERRERREDDDDNEMTRKGEQPPERSRWRQSPLRSRNQRYRGRMTALPSPALSSDSE